MIGHIPKNTRIFIGLAIITLLVTYLAITLSAVREYPFFGKRQYTGQVSKPVSEVKVDAKEWIEYDDSTYPLKFKHPGDWTSSTALTSEKYYNINLDIPDSNQDINIYIGKNGYFGLGGLNAKPFSIANAEGTIVNGGLIGLKSGEYYYTFDASMQPELEEEFNEMIKTIRFE